MMTKSLKEKEVVRQIVSGWLLMEDSIPVMLSPNKEKVGQAIAKLKKKESETTLINIIIHAERFKEIGRNLIMWSLPKFNGSIMNFRNRLVLQTHAEGGDWEIVKNNNGIPHKMTYEQMNQWLLDHMKYVTKEME